MFVVLDDYTLPCLLIVRNVICSLTQMQSLSPVEKEKLRQSWYQDVNTEIS